MIMCPQKDCFNYLHVNNPKAREKVLEKCQFTVYQIFGEKSTQKKEKINLVKKTVKQAGLDLFLISSIVFTKINKTDIFPGDRTDHPMICLSLNINIIEKESSYWKFNDTLLKDSIYVNKIKETIQTVK